MKRKLISRVINFILLFVLIVSESSIYTEATGTDRDEDTSTGIEEDNKEAQEGKGLFDSLDPYVSPAVKEIQDVKPQEPQMVIKEAGNNEGTDPGDYEGVFIWSGIFGSDTSAGVAATKMNYWIADMTGLTSTVANEGLGLATKPLGVAPVGTSVEAQMTQRAIEQYSKSANAGIFSKLAWNGRMVGGCLSLLSFGLNAVSFTMDTIDLWKGFVQGDDSVWKQRSTTGRVVEKALVVADAGCAGYGMWLAGGMLAKYLAGAAIVGTPVGWATIIGVGVVGVATAVVHSDKGAEWMDSWGKKADKWWQERITNICDNSIFIYDEVGIFTGWWKPSSDYNDHLIRQPYGTGAYKPNIYVYGLDGDLSVSFMFPDLLTRGIPDYNGCWNVTAQPDGTLTAADGTVYGYLFYESETQPYYFQTEEGWVIDADSRAEQYEEILMAYGFNETEIADFVDFWVEKLPEGVDYMIYPQLTDTVDMAMPVVISPEPEHIFRLWFAFETYEGQEVPEPEVEQFARDGYSVVEWGGVILDER